MKTRCSYKNASNFERYGGRGISICERWLSFENFLEDMGDAPNGFQIDRIDNNKGYYPENCRWVSPSDNCKNTRRNVFLSYREKKMCIADWSVETGIPARTISYRVSCGMPIDEILNKQKTKKPKSEYTGVTYSKNTNGKNWMARKQINGKRKYLGHFKTEELAFEAYNKEQE